MINNQLTRLKNRNITRLIPFGLVSFQQALLDLNPTMLLRGGSGSTVDDVSANDNDATVVGSPTFGEQGIDSSNTAILCSFTGTSGYIEYTIDNTKIDSDLTDFPVLIIPTDSAFFNKIDSDSKRKKVWFTLADGTTRLYAEIRQDYDFSSQRIAYYVKVPSLSSSSETVIRMYFDSSIEDQTTYTDDTGGAAAQAVWDSNFKAVYHKCGSAFLTDSTSNSINGVGTNIDASDVVDDLGGQAIDYDGSTERVTWGSVGDFSTTGNITVEAYVKPDNVALGLNVNQSIFNTFVFVGSGNSKGVILDLSGENPSASRFRFRIRDTDVKTPTLAVADTAIYVVGRYDGADGRLWLDGGTHVGNVAVSAPIAQTTFAATEGRSCSSNVEYFDGGVGETRISFVSRSDAWLKATNYSIKNDLVSEGLFTALGDYIDFSNNPAVAALDGSAELSFIIAQNPAVAWNSGTATQTIIDMHDGSNGLKIEYASGDLAVTMDAVSDSTTIDLPAEYDLLVGAYDAGTISIYNQDASGNAQLLDTLTGYPATYTKPSDNRGFIKPNATVDVVGVYNYAFTEDNINTAFDSI